MVDSHAETFLIIRMTGADSLDVCVVKMKLAIS